MGVNDRDAAVASEVALEYGTTARSQSELLAAADLVSVAVPTRHHYETVRNCIDTGTHALVEKPFVEDVDQGRDLARRAREAGITLQVGHIERFNPATRVLSEIVPDLEVVAVDIQRLGPPVDREGNDSVVRDLMIHDIDILLSLVDEEPESIAAMANGRQYTSVQLGFGDSVASLTASRMTQEKVRRLAVTAEDCRVNVDFVDQTVEIHRLSLPEYVEADGDVRYRHESVVERPMVENGEPLKAELTAFVEAVRNGSEPLVTPEEGIRVLEVVDRIERAAYGDRLEAESA